MSAVSIAKTIYCQAVVGPPGSGKTTYCMAVKQFLRTEGRQSVLVNLDPGNEVVSADYEVDVRKIINLAELMQEMTLGPNGAMVMAMELVEQLLPNFMRQIEAKLEEKQPCRSVIFDFPGQIELYTHYESVQNILRTLEKKWECRVVVIHIVDSQHCLDPTRFMSVLLLSLNAMLRLSMPHVNVLSKMDLLRRNESLLAFDFSYYTEVLSLNYLMKQMPKDSFMEKYKKLTKAICGVVEDYSLVTFKMLDARNMSSLATLMQTINMVHGYAERRAPNGLRH